MSPLSFQKLFTVPSFFFSFSLTRGQSTFLVFSKDQFWALWILLWGEGKDWLSIRFSTLGCHGPFLLGYQYTKTGVQVQQLIKYLPLNSLSIHPLIWECLTFLPTYECIFYWPPSVIPLRLFSQHLSGLPCLWTRFTFHSNISLTEFCLLVKRNFLKDCLISPSIWVPGPQGISTSDHT